MPLSPIPLSRRISSFKAGHPPRPAARAWRPLSPMRLPKSRWPASNLRGPWRWPGGLCRRCDCQGLGSRVSDGVIRQLQLSASSRACAPSSRRLGCCEALAMAWRPLSPMQLPAPASALDVRESFQCVSQGLRPHVAEAVLAPVLVRSCGLRGRWPGGRCRPCNCQRQLQLLDVRESFQCVSQGLRPHVAQAVLAEVQFS